MYGRLIRVGDPSLDNFHVEEYFAESQLQQVAPELDSTGHDMDVRHSTSQKQSRNPGRNESGQSDGYIGLYQSAGLGLIVDRVC